MALPEYLRSVLRTQAILSLVLLGCHHEKASTAPDTTPPGPVSLNSSDRITTTSLTLSWLAPGDDDSRGIADRYEVRVARSPLTSANVTSAARAPNVPRPLAAGTTQSLQVLNLESGTNYYFALRAADEVPNWSDWSFLGPIATRPDTIAPAPVTDLHVVSVADQSVILAWTAPGDDDRSGRAAEYDLRISPTPIDSSNFGSATRIRGIPNPADPGALQQVTAPGLTPRHRFYAALTTRDEAGNFSKPSSTVTFITDRSPRDWIVRNDGSGDAPTIQAAIDSARTGETVFVYPGLYLAHLRILEKGIRLASVSGSEATVLDGFNQPGSVVEIRMVPADTVVISGFTIRNGSGTSPFHNGLESPTGGGIFTQDANCVIRDNNITQNGSGAHRPMWGGGIFCEVRYQTSTVLCRVANNVISNNHASINGGGIGSQQVVLLTINDNVISGNWTDQGDGGGIWAIFYASGLQIASNRIVLNTAGDHGGGIHLGSVPGRFSTIRANVIAGNQALQGDPASTSTGGGGILCYALSGAIANNTFYGNACRKPQDPNGGSLTIDTPLSLDVSANIISGTLSGCAISSIDVVRLSLCANLFWANSDGNVCPDRDGIFRQECNIEADPLFCDPHRLDFSLLEGSPAVDFNGVRIGAPTHLGCDDTKRGATRHAGFDIPRRK